MKNVFIRGSVVRYVHLPGAAVDTALLEDATRRGKWWYRTRSYRDTANVYVYNRSGAAGFEGQMTRNDPVFDY